MERIKELELQIRIMANTIDTQEKIIAELKRVLPQADVVKSQKCQCKDPVNFNRLSCPLCAPM